MALRTVILLLALLGAVVSVHVAGAHEVGTPTVAAATTNVGDNTNSSVPTIPADLYDDVVVVDGESLDAIAAHEAVAEELALEGDVGGEGQLEFEVLDGADDEEEDADAVLDSITEGDGELDVEGDGELDVEGDGELDVEGDSAEEALSPAHPLARILTSRSSKRCWSKRNCKKFYKKPGCCKKKCVNLASDNKNCGKCGKCCNTRKGYRCTSGKCKMPKPVKTHSYGSSTSSCGKNKRCVRGYTCCKGKCVKLASNKNNCGKCGRRCKSGYSCNSGKCHKSAPPTLQCGKHKKCTRGYTCCKGKCVNLGKNNGHCGKCDKGCDTKKGFTCKSGKCLKSSPPSASECGTHKKCKSGQSCCKGKCVSLSTDNKNCGMCHKCCDTAKGYSCKIGKCVKKPTASQCGRTKCKPGQTCCHSKCVSLSTDSRNCGQCGKACDRKKGYCCKAGKCVKSTPSPSQCGKENRCKSGYTCCNGKCVNLKGNNGHCGKCNKGCGYGSACCQGTCKNIKNDDRNCGKCGKTCGYGRKCCHGYCINVFGSDKNHCGACGKKCPTTCKFGMCGYGQ